MDKLNHLKGDVKYQGKVIAVDNDAPPIKRDVPKYDGTVSILAQFEPNAEAQVSGVIHSLTKGEILLEPTSLSIAASSGERGVAHFKNDELGSSWNGGYHLRFWGEDAHDATGFVSLAQPGKGYYYANFGATKQK